MKIETKCNPFTGHEMKVPVFDDGSFIFDRAYTHETIAVGYDKEHDLYLIPAKVFENIYSVSLVEASEILGVSKMRVSALCANGQLQYSKVNNVLRITYDSVISYRDTRKGYAKELKHDDRANGKHSRSNAN